MRDKSAYGVEPSNFSIVQRLYDMEMDRDRNDPKNRAECAFRFFRAILKMETVAVRLYCLRWLRFALPCERFQALCATDELALRKTTLFSFPSTKECDQHLPTAIFSDSIDESVRLAVEKHYTESKSSFASAFASHYRSQADRFDALEKMVANSIECIEKKAAKNVVVVKQQNPSIPPFPGLPWWIGTEKDWHTFSVPLLEQRCFDLDDDGNAVWRRSAGLAGLIARAAARKQWLRHYLGEQSYSTFLREFFKWPKGPPKSKNAFDRHHLSQKDLIFCEAILPRYGFDTEQIKEQLNAE